MPHQTPKAAGKPRLLIFVIAYYAESTLKKVLERIPAVIFQDYDCEVLVVDDASEDRTFAIGREYKESHPEIRMTVLRNGLNQGYGGNQKVGYTYAITEGFDFVAMVHGDGQYAPEELPRLMEPLRRGETDAVFGSRMMEAFGALRGGMPLYKFVGNRVLSTVQNKLLGTKLSEFHSGYRIYSVNALKALPYRLNSNDFHFDTEIIIQLLNAKRRILELAIPTYYGDEICRVNGMKYAKDVMLATLKNVAHRSGILYQRRFDTAPRDEATQYDLKLGYPSSHSWALEQVPEGAHVLDIGSRPEGLAEELVTKGCDVAVVRPPEAKQPGGKVRTFVQDLNQDPTFPVGPFKYLLLLDVIEHLKSPERFFEKLRTQFEHEGKTLILTTPNVAFAPQRLMLLLGQFNYGKSGVLDMTHSRLFTFRSIRQLLLDSGFRIKEIRGVPAPFPKVFGNGLLGKAALAANQAAIRVSKTLFSYQVFIVAESTPDVEFVLGDAKHPTGDRAAKLRTDAAARTDEGAKRARVRRRPASA
jgi:glycosyltransferase involved in cell wall biosynthesis/2-polyprenyl-3-methyl-5-hydroxy-6-metoxy-1,4-benzoquinol methylase